MLESLAEMQGFLVYANLADYNDTRDGYIPVIVTSLIKLKPVLCCAQYCILVPTYKIGDVYSYVSILVCTLYSTFLVEFSRIKANIPQSGHQKQKSVDVYGFHF